MMRCAVLTVLVIGLAWSAEGSQLGMNFRLLEAKGLKLEPAKGKVETPAEINSAADLARAFPAKETQQAIAKQVDFTKDQLLYFAWSGSSGDKLEFRNGFGGNFEALVVTYTRGDTNDVKQHHYLVAFPKKGDWVFATQK